MKRLLSLIAAVTLAWAGNAYGASVDVDRHRNFLIVDIKSTSTAAGVIDTLDNIDVSEVAWFHDGGNDVAGGMHAPYKLIIWQDAGDSVSVSIDAAYWSSQEQRYQYANDEGAATFSGDTIVHNRANDRVAMKLRVIVNNNDTDAHGYHIRFLFLRDGEGRR